MPAVENDITEIPTEPGTQLPRTAARDRRRAAVTAPRLGPGRYLAIEDGSEVVVIPIEGESLRLGRSTSADVILEDVSVSRRHAVVVRRNQDTVVLDDRSQNGVVVNGQRVGGAVLDHGDEIRLGRVAMRYLHVP